MSDLSRKRARYQGNDDSPPPDDTRTRDDDYWFEDGNIILVAEEVEFRVYAGPLMRCSPVFREMLSLPQPQADHVVDLSIPIVRLFDHPSDIRRLLGSVIFGNDFRFIKASPDYNTLSSLIRMGHKYEVDHAVEAAMEYLEPYYPIDITDFESLRPGPPNFSPRDHIGIVNLARLTNTPDMLLVAFLHCCALDPEVLVEGFEREDGTMETLSQRDLTTVLIARAELVKADALDALYILSVADDCETVEECRQTLVAVLYEIGAQELSRAFSAGWRTPWKRYLKEIDMLPCDRCVDAIEEREEQKTEELWNNWPAMVGLE